jgi:hypothetical protein
VKPTKNLVAFFSLVQKRAWILLSSYHSIYLQCGTTRPIYPLVSQRLWLLCMKECAQASSIDSHHIKNAVLVTAAPDDLRLGGNKIVPNFLPTNCLYVTWNLHKTQSFVCVCTYQPIVRYHYTRMMFGTIRYERVEVRCL